MNITESFLDFTLLGAEWVLWLLIALSVVSAAIALERWRFFARRKIDLEQLEGDVRQALKSGDIDQAVAKYADSPALPAVVAMSGLADASADADAVAQAMNSAKAAARGQHERNLIFLGTLGNNAPFIGLFGTVLGIIKAFNDLAANPQGDANVVMSGISEALVATAVGLMVAIPAVVTFNYFNRKVRAALGEADSLAHAILGALHKREKSEPALEPALETEVQ